MIWRIYLKEMKDSLRDRKTLLLSVLMPIILIAGITLFQEKMFFGESEPEIIPVAVNESIEDVTYQWLSDIELVELNKVEDPLQAAIDGEARVGIDIDQHFITRIKAGEFVDITLFADQTSMKNSQALAYIRRELESFQQQIIDQRLASEGVNPELISPFAIQTEALSQKDEGSLMLLSMLFSLVIVMSVMLGGFPAATDLFAGEKERKTMESLLVTPVPRLKLIMAKWLTISTLGVVSGGFAVFSFALIMKLFTKNLAAALDFEDKTLLLLFSAMVGIVLFSFMFATIQTMISIIANTFKEAQNYLSPFMFIALIPYFLLVGVVPNELNTMHFLIPVMNIYALLKELIYGVFSLQSILLVSGSSVITIIVGFYFANWMFKKDKWVLGK